MLWVELISASSEGQSQEAKTHRNKFEQNWFPLETAINIILQFVSFLTRYLKVNYKLKSTLLVTGAAKDKIPISSLDVLPEALRDGINWACNGLLFLQKLCLILLSKYRVTNDSLNFSSQMSIFAGMFTVCLFIDFGRPSDLGKRSGLICLSVTLFTSQWKDLWPISRNSCNDINNSN